MPSDYLMLRLRELTEFHDEIEAKLAAFTDKQHALSLSLLHADHPIAYDEIAQAIDQLSDEIAALQDRLDMIEEEIAWRDRCEERRDTPIVV